MFSLFCSVQWLCFMWVHSCVFQHSFPWTKYNARLWWGNHVHSNTAFVQAQTHENLTSIHVALGLQMKRPWIGVIAQLLLHSLCDIPRTQGHCRIFQVMVSESVSCWASIAYLMQCAITRVTVMVSLFLTKLWIFNVRTITILHNAY